MDITIQPISEAHIDGFRSALDAVARERRYLWFTQAPPEEQVAAFVRDNIKNDHPQFVALDDDRVVGWCDVCPHVHPGTQHSGHLGMGVMKAWRGQGIGPRLLETTLAHAFDRGFVRVELEVFSSNERAARLYERFGFEREGIKRRARCLDGRWDDNIVMAIVRDPEVTEKP